MMATIPHVTSGLGLRKFQADGFLFDTSVQRARESLSCVLCYTGINKIFFWILKSLLPKD